MTAGRKTLFKDEFIDQAKKLCLKGFIDDEIADFFGIAVSTLNLWKQKHPRFMESLKDGKRFCDDKVEESLYKRALGSEYDEVKVEEENGSVTKTTTTTKKSMGDTTAQIFWLKNRQRERWTQSTDSDITVNNIMPVPTADSIEGWEASAQAQQSEILNRND